MAMMYDPPHLGASIRESIEAEGGRLSGRLSGWG